MRALAIACLLAGCGDNIAGREPESEPEPAWRFEDDVWGGNFAVADGRVFYTTFNEGGPSVGEHAVWSMPAAFGAPTQIWRGGPGKLFGKGMAVHEGRVFWSSEHDDGGPNGIFAAPISGGAREEVGRFHTTTAPYVGVHVDATHVYAASFDEIVRVPLAGGDVETVFTAQLGEVAWFELERDAGFRATRVLLTTWGGSNAFHRIDVATSIHATLAELDEVTTTPFCRDDAAAYVMGRAAIMRVPLDGSPAQQVANLDRPRGCARDGRFLYTFVDGELVRIDVTAMGTPEVIGAVDVPLLEHLVVADGALFYAGLGEIGRVPLAP